MKYLTLNVRSEPKPPSEDRPFRFNSPHHCYTTPQWFSMQYPFMAFCLSDPKWEGELLWALKGSFNSLPVFHYRGKGWALKPEFRDIYLQLETALTGIYQYHLRRTALTFPHTLDIQKFSPPGHWGYLNHYKTEHEARRATYNSRNAFVPLMALCAYALAGEPRFHPLEEKKWVRYHVEDLRMDTQWANLLASSEIFSPTCARVGMYVDNDILPTNLLAPLLAFNRRQSRR